MGALERLCYNPPMKSAMKSPMKSRMKPSNKPPAPPVTTGYQSFADTAPPARNAANIKALRAKMRAQNLDGFIVPRADEHQGEYVAPSAERLAWLTGFTGSAGTAIVFARKAALFVDGRYTLQAAQQTPGNSFEIKDIGDLADWLKARLKPGARLGFNPRLHTIAAFEKLGKLAKAAGAQLIAADPGPLDLAWGAARPAPPLGPAHPHPLKYAGQPARKKLAGIANVLKQAGEDAVILTQPDAICWAFNIRGRDILHIPVVLCFAIVPASGRPELFIAPEKLGKRIRDYLKPLARLHPPSALEQRLKELGKSRACIRLDRNMAAIWFHTALKAAGAEISHGSDPCLAPKARKNKAEISGARAAHLRDGLAVTRFLAWLDASVDTRAPLDEIRAARALEEFRARAPEMRDISFPAISAVGANGAIVHYRVREASNRKFTRGTLYLIDSGAQYPDGTTDITRTIAIGTPTAEMRRNFTLVLKGHIALARAKFPNGTSGGQLDALARAPLWQAGLDFDHGTGHGIGSYLSVHEGPQGISKRSFATALEPGMIVSNEPGYYKPGAYGIRIENLLLVVEADKPKGMASTREMLAFETLTLAPIDRRLVDAGLLEPAERSWLNSYHERVKQALSPRLSAADRRWLTQATKAI